MGKTLSNRKAFSLVEILIVVIMLGIMAMIVLPKFSSSADDTRESALAMDYANTSRQIELYKHQHAGRGPETDESGSLDTANFISRMTGRTTQESGLDANGEFGPYLMAWPSNPFIEGAAASQITFGKDPPLARDGATGWYYSWKNRRLYVNSTAGGADLP